MSGTDKERGLLKWRKQDTINTRSSKSSPNSYDLPLVASFLKEKSFFKYIPISPYYEEGRIWNSFLDWISNAQNKQKGTQ